MKVVLVSAKAEHGKDYAAEVMKQELEGRGKKVLVAHYADLLKWVCKQFFSWNGEKDEEGRSLLQRVGTEKIRSVYPYYWSGFLQSILKCFPDEWDYVIIPDVRFPDEIEVMQEFDCVSVRVIRDNFETSLTAEQQSHASETSLDDWDFDVVLHNHSDEKFADDVKMFVRRELLGMNDVGLNGDLTINGEEVNAVVMIEKQSFGSGLVLHVPKGAKIDNWLHSVSIKADL